MCIDVLKCVEKVLFETKEMIMDSRQKRQQPTTTLAINGEDVEKVSSFKCLGVSADSTWEMNTSVVIKKAQKRS